MAPTSLEPYKERVRTAEEAVRMIARGKTVFIGTAAGEPQELVRELARLSSEMGDNEIIQALSLFLSPQREDMMKYNFRFNALFVGPEVRLAVKEGRGEYTPTHLSEMASLFDDGLIHIDYALIQVAPPDVNGNCSLGVSVDITKSAAKAADFVIAQVNPQMPTTSGDSSLHVTDIDALVWYDEPLLEWKKAAEELEYVQAIGKHVAALVDDGSTIQVGYGAIPDAVLAYLGDKRDLGVHTEMFSDGLIDLIEKGVVTCKKKSSHPGKVLASFSLGSKKLYDYVNKNELFEFYPSSYINSPCTIRANKRMVAINSALAVDMTGQVCADQLEHEFYSGIGGLADFMRGASMSKGGKAIIALPSTAAGGTISRIVPTLPDGSAVTVNRCDVHYVVTEYGIAELRGKSIEQRSLELIEVAHPKFRYTLLEQAKQLGYVRSELSTAPFTGRPYPVHLERAVTINGTPVRIRPLKTTDEELIKAFYYSLSEKSVYDRFMSYEKMMPREIRNLLSVDYGGRMAVMALIRKEEGPVIVGIGTYDVDPGTGWAEVALTVVDEFQNFGLGTEIFRTLMEYGRDLNLKGFTAEILATNIRMINIFHFSGLKVESKMVDDVIQVRAFL